MSERREGFNRPGKAAKVAVRRGVKGEGLVCSHFLPPGMVTDRQSLKKLAATVTAAGVRRVQ